MNEQYVKDCMILAELKYFEKICMNIIGLSFLLIRIWIILKGL